MPIGLVDFDGELLDYLEFGTGDIRMGTIKLTDKTTGDKNHLFAFASGEPTKIGFVPDKKDRPDIEDIELIFRFTKLESLDVLIGALREHKKFLKKQGGMKCASTQKS